MLGDLALESVAAHDQAVYRRAIKIRLDSKPLRRFDMPTINPLERFTNFRYTIKFEPSSARVGRPYLIKADIIRLGKIGVRDENDMKAKAKTEPALAWLMRWTNILDLFDIALMCYKVDIQIGVDVRKYSDYIKSICPEQADEDYVVFYAPEIAEARMEYVKERYNRILDDRRKTLERVMEEEE